jgi:hypothetical protein
MLCEALLHALTDPAQHIGGGNLFGARRIQPVADAYAQAASHCRTTRAVSTALESLEQKDNTQREPCYLFRGHDFLPYCFGT